MKKSLLVMAILGFCTMGSQGHATDEPGAVVDPTGGAPVLHRLCVVVSDSLDLSQALTVTAGTAARLGAKVGVKALRQTPYVTANGIRIEGISEWPFIILKGKVGKLRSLLSALAGGTIPHVTGVEGGVVVCVALFGPEELVRPITKSFSMCSRLTGGLTAGAADPDSSIVCVVDESLGLGPALNAVAHMAVGFGSRVGAEALRDKDVVVVRRRPDYIRVKWDALQGSDIPHTTFLDTMHLGPTAVEQIAATAERTIAEIRILGVCWSAAPF